MRILTMTITSTSPNSIELHANLPLTENIDNSKGKKRLCKKSKAQYVVKVSKACSSKDVIL